MEKEELKLKLWAMTGIMMTLQANGLEAGLDLEQSLKMLEKALETYDGTDRIEQLVDARRILDELYKEIIGE
jgi:hypothetical protein